MIKYISITIAFAFISLFAFSQVNLSSDFDNPTLLQETHECEYSEFVFDHTAGNDLDLPRCNRIYPGASSYFTFTVPESGRATLRLQFEEEVLFGLAFYSMQFGEYTEIKCDVFRDTEAALIIYPQEGFAGTEILARFWKLGEGDAGLVNLCISAEAVAVPAKVLSINAIVYTPEELVLEVLLTGCLSASNIQYVGDPGSIGYFSNAIPGLDFAEGVILSSGNITDAPGPNTSSSTGTNMGTVGDADLDAIALGATQDAAVLEFDFVPASDLLEFEYVFGSDEYPEFANSSYNDAFAFFISGGPEAYVNQNIALIPGTAIPVTINEVNDVDYPQYYINNETSPNIEYDGLLTTFTATTVVTACETYHIKMAIADVGDGSYDSAVFLKANSFTSGESYTVESFNAWSNSLQIMRGCSNYIVFSRTDATPLDQPVPIELNVTGTATMGVDYSNIPAVLEIPAGEDELIFYFDAYDVGVVTGDLTIILNFENGCPCDAGTTQHIITIIDSFVIDPVLTNNSPICLGDTATLNLILNTPDDTDVIIEWSTGEIDEDSILVSPLTSTIYSVDIIYPCDTITLTTNVVVVEPPVVDLGPDFDVAELFTNLNAGMPAGNTGVWLNTGGPGVANIAPIDNSATTASVDVFGVYSFSWTETSLAPNCVSSDTIDVNFYHIPTADFEATQILCFGDYTTIIFTGDIIDGLAIFTWDFGNGTIISGSGEGPYVISFPDAGDHTVGVTINEDVAEVSNSINVIVPPLLGGTMTIGDDPCFESCGGTATFDVVGGTAPYTYTWGSTSNTMSNLCAGDYGITVNDVYGCEYITPYSIAQPTLLEYDTSYYHVNCYGEFSGGASIWASGGTAPYQYFWSDGFNMGDHDNIMAGIYQVTVYDDHGCSVFEQFDITQPDLLTVVTSGDYAICENQPINIAAQQGGGTLPYTYYWDNGDGNGFSAGPQTFQIIPHEDMNYTVYVVDGHNCVSDYAFSDIIVSPEYHLSLTIVNNTCFESCDASAELGIVGGLQPFDFSWGSDGPEYEDLCAGLYTVTITDQIGCTADTMFVITEPTLLQLELDTEDANCSYTEDGSSVATVTGGSPPYSYMWVDNTQINEFIGGEGTYYLTVSDDHNCRVYGTAVIESPDAMIVLPLYEPTICIGGESQVIAQAAGGTPPYYFYWNGTDGTEYWEHLFQASPETSTTYNLTVTDDNGCTVVGHHIDVTVHPPLVIEDVINSISDVCLGHGTSIELVISGGNGGPYQINTSEGSIVGSPFTYYPEETTNLIFTVADQCETPVVYDSIMIYVHDKPFVDFTSAVNEGCPGQYISFTSLDTVENCEYVWSFGDEVFAFVKNPTHQYNEEGLYSVSLLVRDEFGCEDSLRIDSMVEIWPKPYANFAAEPEIASILNPYIKFQNYSEEAVFYFWYYGDGDSTINFRHPQHLYTDMGEYEVMLVSENEYGCSDTAMRTVLIRDEYTLYAPTAFTPNGDGVNDCFRLCGNGIDPYSFKILIYNRWGELVFVTEEYDDETACETCSDGAWDGTKGSRVLGDKYLPNGMYYWYATFVDQDNIGHEHQGNIQLIR